MKCKTCGNYGGLISRYVGWDVICMKHNLWQWRRKVIKTLGGVKCAKSVDLYWRKIRNSFVVLKHAVY